MKTFFCKYYTQWVPNVLRFFGKKKNVMYLHVNVVLFAFYAHCNVFSCLNALLITFISLAGHYLIIQIKLSKGEGHCC